jgi:hypothetical protein
MGWQAPNLARARFENLRPLTRISVLLAALALAATAWNAKTWMETGAIGAEKAAELARLNRETTEANARIATLEDDLRAADLEAENERTQFLNQRIAERAFSWNLLLDRLVEAMPPGVRLRQLSPAVERPGGRSRAAARTAGPETVSLRVAGEAEDDEALLEFVDRLFADEHFRAPDLAGESTREDGLLQFQLAVRYLPGDLPAPGADAGRADAVETPAPAAPAGGAAGAGAGKAGP